MVTRAISRKVATALTIARAAARGIAAFVRRASSLVPRLTPEIFSLPLIFRCDSSLDGRLQACRPFIPDGRRIPPLRPFGFAATARRMRFHALFFFALLPGTGRAEGIARKMEMPPPEYQLKSAFIYKFATFIDWPANIGKTLMLCTAVPNDVMPYFNSLAGKRVGEMTLAVRQLRPDDSAAGCRILFVSGVENGNFDNWLSEIGEAKVLTIAESNGWLKKGVVMRLVLQDNRVTFDVNLEAARGENIEIDSRLLRLARKVYGLDKVNEPADQNAE